MPYFHLLCLILCEPVFDINMQRVILHCSKGPQENYGIILLVVVFGENSSMNVDLWQPLKCILCPWKSRMACSHSNLSPKVKLTSNQHLQPFPLPCVQVRLQKLCQATRFPAVCETVVAVERRKEREISYQSPPEADVIFHHMHWIVPVMCCWSFVSLWIVRWLVSQPILWQWLWPMRLDYTL